MCKEREIHMDRFTKGYVSWVLAVPLLMLPEDTPSSGTVSGHLVRDGLCLLLLVDTVSRTLAARLLIKSLSKCSQETKLVEEIFPQGSKKKEGCQCDPMPVAHLPVSCSCPASAAT